MADGRLEFLVEPFKENAPGPHVIAALEVLERAGLEYDLGPFATTVEGDVEVLLSVIGDLYRAGMAAGATRIRSHIELP